jgi:cytochrome c biogenesis protein CcmG/thiol:disulfide interchange protein DsbE
MKALKFLAPLAIFWRSSAFFAVGLTRDPREVPSPLHRQAAPGFKLEQPAGYAGRVHARGDEGQGVDVERLGIVVRLVPRRASAPGGALAQRNRSHRRPQLQGRREDALPWLAKFGDPYALSVGTSTDEWASTTASTARPRPS